MLRRLSLRSTTQAGAAPSALALSADGSTIFIALSGDNALALVHRPTTGPLSITGRIPTADYLTSVTLDARNHQLLLTTGKGTLQQETYPAGAPVRTGAPGSTGLGVSGVIEAIAMPTPGELAAYSRQVAANNQPPTGAALGLPVGQVGKPGKPNPQGITHVVYVIRENKTFDEEFGDLPGGAPALLMYPQAVTPNAHAIATTWPLLTNYYDNEEVSDTGHQALLGGNANDWTQRLTQQAYGLDGTPRQGAELGNGSSLLWSAGDYLLDSALAKGISFRDYGEYYRQNQTLDGPALTASLDSHIDHHFPGFGFTPDLPDTKRITYWQQQFRQQEASHSFPALTVLYLPEDHTTNGVSTTPQGEVADADLALGQLVQTLSHSREWDSTLMVMTEDDPQSGLDHIDQHRSIALLAGGHVRTGLTVTAHLDQSGLLATIEDLLGLHPLTEFDATATRFTGLLTTTGSAPSFTALTPSVPVLPAAAMAALRTRANAIVGATPGGQSNLPAW